MMSPTSALISLGVNLCPAYIRGQCRSAAYYIGLLTAPTLIVCVVICVAVVLADEDGVAVGASGTITASVSGGGFA